MSIQTSDKEVGSTGRRTRMPESPRWLRRHDRHEDTQWALAKLGTDVTLDDIDFTARQLRAADRRRKVATTMAGVEVTAIIAAVGSTGRLMAANFALIEVFPTWQSGIGLGWVMVCSAAISVLAIGIYRFLPETKNRSVEEITRLFEEQAAGHGRPGAPPVRGVDAAAA